MPPASFIVTSSRTTSIVTPRGQLKVLDFGLAKLAPPDLAAAETMERLTMEGSAIGTPGFMSPEQLRGREIDARSDIFSLGVTLYECATGTSAFHGATSLEVAMRVMTATPPRPSELNPAVPPALDAIIARAMAKDAAVRYESARSLHADLRELKHALDGATTAVGATAPSPTKVRGKSIGFKTVIAASAVTVLVAAWFASGLLRRGHHVPPPEAVEWYDRGTSAIREGAYFQASKALGQALETRQDVCPRAGRGGPKPTRRWDSPPGPVRNCCRRCRCSGIARRCRLRNRAMWTRSRRRSRRDFKTAIEKYLLIAELSARQGTVRGVRRPWPCL